MKAQQPGATGRLAALRRGSKLLLMDRATGRSAFMAAENEPVLRLATTAHDVLPAQLKPLGIRVRDELAQLGIGSEAQQEATALRVLILKLTTGCNNRCRYCYDTDEESCSSRVDLDPDLAASALEQALALCDRGLLVVLHGGEPLLRFQALRDLVITGERLASERGVSVAFVGQTNLSLITEEMERFFRAHNVSWGISLDGPPPLNDRVRMTRGGAGTHEVFVEKARRFPGLIRRSLAQATITAMNHSSLLEISRHFRDLGLRGWEWSLFQPAGRGRSTPDLAPDPQTLLSSWNELLDHVISGELDGFSVEPVLRYLRNLVNGPGGNMCLRPACGAARDLLSVAADGTIQACDCMPRDNRLGRLGHLRDTTLAEALTSRSARHLRDRDVTAGSGQCGRCFWLGICGGTCVARVDQINDIDETECMLALNAFERISSHLATSDRLQRYLESVDS